MTFSGARASASLRLEWGSILENGGPGTHIRAVPPRLSRAAPQETSMAAPRMQPIFESLKASGPTRADSVGRIAALAHLLDSAIPIPGTNRRVGIDALLGLIPGVGDAVSAALASYIIWEARQLGLPRWKIARMVGNLALDTTVGAVPLLGDLFDMAYKSNQRNMRIVIEHLERTGRMGPGVIEGTAVRVEEPRLGGRAR
ncbi:MAG: hypothetical protein AVDCRST_MAG90-2402 [uncultured Microvirga sp.]|uniref:Bll7046 protein n=1 Tax=uncultured Microvirga sp. TaxID=412392 RepID=A0A6J4M6I8_9HYPH|nr:MAG: hypothetical protein AVDCRST_MAG90-2402 [uncultured Microvirga sp.]